MNKSITDTLSLLEQATDILMQAIRKSTDMKDCQDMIFSNIQIIKTIKAINDRCGKTAPGNNQKSKKTEILRTIEYTIHAEGVSLKNCAGPGGYAVIIRRNDGYTEKGAKGFNSGAIIHALDKISEARKRKKFNANPQMLTEWLMLQILEGKFKWQNL